MVLSGKLVSVKKNTRHFSLFQFNQEYHAGFESYIYRFEIWEEGRELEEKFTFLLKIMDNGKDLKVIDLFPPNYYQGKGISIAIILKAKQLLGKRIISSSNSKRTFTGEMRRENATEKVWNRMVNQGLAKYNARLDYYYTL